MSLTTAIIILALGAGLMYILWKYVPSVPIRNVLLWIVGLALVIWFLEILGFITWIGAQRIK